MYDHPLLVESALIGIGGVIVIVGAVLLRAVRPSTKRVLSDK